MAQYDVVIIGGGPGGYNAGIRAAQLGLKAAVVESRGTLGGTCLNVGCMPSKALLHASELYEAANKDFATLGIEVAPKLNLVQMMAQKAESVTALTKGIEFLFKKNKADWIKGMGRIAGPGRVEVTGPDGSTFAFPVGTPPDVISGAMSKHYGAMPRSTTGTQSGDEARANAAGDTRAKMRLEDIQAAYRVAQQRGVDAEKNLGPKSTKDLIAPELRAQSQAQYDAARKEQEAMAEAYVQRERADNPHMAITDRTRTIGRGAPVLGAAGDEINAFLNSPLSAMGLSDNGQAYQEGLDYQRARNRVFDREHPKESLGLQIGGGIASGVAAAPLIAGAPAALTSAGLPTAGRVAATAIGQNAPLAGQVVRGAIAGAATGAADSAPASSGRPTFPRALARLKWASA